MTGKERRAPNSKVTMTDEYIVQDMWLKRRNGDDKK